MKMDNLEAAKQYFIAGAIADPRVFTLDHAMNTGQEQFVNVLDTMWEGLIDGVRAEAWEEGRMAGEFNEHEHRPDREMTNPFTDHREDD